MLQSRTIQRNADIIENAIFYHDNFSKVKGKQAG
jgi:hypothetical protein